MSKKTKFLIGLTITILLIGLIFGIFTMVRFCKLQSILNQVKENVEKNNYYMKTTIINNGTSKNTETYYKSGVGKFVSEDGTYMWTDGTNAYLVDEVNKEIRVLDSKEILGIINKESFASLYPGYTMGFFKRLIIAGDISNKFKTDYHNGQKCTVITITENEYTKTFWITKDMHNLIKAEIKFSNGDKYEYKYNLIFHSTQSRDMYLPDISEYTVIENTTGKTIEADVLENNIKLETQNIVVENVITNVVDTPIG